MFDLQYSAQELHINATFKMRLAQPTNDQLLIVMAMYMGQVNIFQAFPVAYILMRRKTEAAYQSVFEFISEMYGVRATNIVTDY